eukprot:1065469-Prorocentrum_minimum.AAC.2
MTAHGRALARVEQSKTPEKQKRILGDGQIDKSFDPRNAPSNRSLPRGSPSSSPTWWVYPVAGTNRRRGERIYP